MIILYWIIEYQNGKSISENEISFKQVDKSNIKNFYFLDDNNKTIGFDAKTGIFFIHDQLYDFKTGNGPFTPIQFKKAGVIWGLNSEMNSQILSRNIGYSIIKNELIYKYIVSIEEDAIYLLASKEDLFNNKIDERKMRLK